MLKSKKHVFWEALLVVVLIFSVGIFLGIMFEESMFSEINSYYAQSEVSFVDGVAMTALIDLEIPGCEELMNFNIDFANRIYEEAKTLEKYEESERLTEKLKLAHKKYDVLRTFLWINNMKIFDRCGENYSLVVYLYEYETQDTTKEATQSVWEKILYDLKQERGNSLVLIPIAVDQNIISLDAVLGGFNIDSYPAVILNNKEVITELKSVSELEELL